MQMLIHHPAACLIAFLSLVALMFVANQLGLIAWIAWLDIVEDHEEDRREEDRREDDRREDTPRRIHWRILEGTQVKRAAAAKWLCIVAWSSGLHCPHAWHRRNPDLSHRQMPWRNDRKIRICFPSRTSSCLLLHPSPKARWLNGSMLC